MCIRHILRYCLKIYNTIFHIFVHFVPESPFGAFLCYDCVSVSLTPLLLTLIGALSPLLTFAWLWQVKEWRLDRMREHLRREGWMRQLFGFARPALLAIHILVYLIPVVRESFLAVLVFISFLSLCAMLSIIQIGLRRQRRPVFTQKAILLTMTAGLITIITAFLLNRSELLFIVLPFLVLLQPLALLLAWLLWYPVDIFLKHRIIFHARAIREAHPNLTVIGITGSVGKTTTKELLACVLQDLHPLVTPAHVNSEIGVARWMTNALSSQPEPQPNPQPLIVEMGAYRRGEIALMSSYVHPTLAIITHIGTQHIALFGSQQALFEAKSELVTALPPDGRAFLNGDNDLARSMSRLSPCPATIVGTGGNCDLEAFDIEETPSGIRFRARDIIFDLPLHGTHNITNVLLAIAAGEHLGIPLERMRDCLKTFTPLSGTFSVREDRGIKILDDTHNSSVASLKAAIAWARTQPEEHKILLAAGLIEMGEEQSPAEQELGALAGNVFERTVVIDPVSARNFAAGGAKNVEMFGANAAKIPAGALLVCVGRMSQSTVERLLPGRATP